VQKEQVLGQLRNNLQHELSQAKKSYESSSAYKSQDDMKQEGKYDTRAIEAGYLAGAQKKRVDEIEQELNMLEEIDLKLADGLSEVITGSLVLLEHNGIEKHYFLSPTGGGKLLTIEGEPVLVISVFSPLGQELVGASVNDDVSIEVNENVKSYLVKKIY
jgi:transcription elongation GreA/GreB family factor